MPSSGAGSGKDFGDGLAARDALTYEDGEHLKLLVLGHYIEAALMGLFGCCPAAGVFSGLFVLLAPSPDMTHVSRSDLSYLPFYLVWMLVAWPLAGLLVYAGHCLKRRRRRVVCLAVNGFTAIACVPFGTVLAVLTFMVLLRPSVRAAFDLPQDVAY